jgi:hypothetical protein
MPGRTFRIDGRNRYITDFTTTQLERFENADYVNINYTEISELPELNSDIETLDCQHNKLIQLPELIYYEDLVELKCSYNKLDSLPELPYRLNVLHCNNNQLTELPFLPEYVYDLQCQKNKLTHLPDLYRINCLNCSNNLLNVLPIFPVSLEIFECDYNDIELLDLRQCLTMAVVKCRNNNLKQFPKLPDGIIKLYLSNNPFMQNDIELKKYKAYIKRNPYCKNDIKKKSNKYRSFKNGREPIGQSKMTRRKLLTIPRRRPTNIYNSDGIIHENYHHFGRRGTRYRSDRRVHLQRTYPQASYTYVNNGLGMNTVSVNSQKKLSPPLRTIRSVPIEPVKGVRQPVNESYLYDGWVNYRRSLGYQL